MFDRGLTVIPGTRLKIEFRQGDITSLPDVDAIVNAANTDLILGSGVAGAILRKGGEIVDDEGRRKAPIKLGEAAYTTAGKLPNKYVIHAAAMGYRPDDALVPKRPGSLSSAEIIRNCTLNSLRIADDLGCTSVAFPALATGVAAFPVDECARAMLGAVNDYAQRHTATKLARVVFVLFAQADYDIFQHHGSSSQ
jgi:O-acetyl-ADP-ribose deacetylase (regulator of RNase III)